MVQHPSLQERQTQIRAEAYQQLRAKGFKFVEELAHLFPLALPTNRSLRLFMPFLGCPPLLSIELRDDLIATITPLKRGACRIEYGNRAGLALSTELLNPFDPDENWVDLGDGRVDIITRLNCDFHVEAAIPRLTICVRKDGPAPVVLRLLRGSVQ